MILNIKFFNHFILYIWPVECTGNFKKNKYEMKTEKTAVNKMGYPFTALEQSYTTVNEGEEGSSSGGGTEYVSLSRYSPLIATTVIS